jgi:ATP-dependent helicase/nuclease subunit A
MQPTSQQETAIYTHDRNLIVVAGAGSGKTRVLVERYLALLEAHPDWPLNALVAITFTEKAAGEMRDRVRQTLEARALGATVPESRAPWNERLSAMESARISTIHSLCATILRANAPEAGVDPRFEVLDEVDARLLLDDVIERVFQGLQRANDDPLGELFVEYDTQAVQWVLVDQISLELPNLPENLFAHWTELWATEAMQAVNTLLGAPAFLDALNWIPEYGWPEGDSLLDVWRAVWSLKQHLDAVTELDLRLGLLAELGSAETINLRSGSAKAWGSKEVLAESKARLGLIRDLTRETLKHIGEQPGAIDERAAYLLPLWVELIRRAQAAYRDAKEKDNLLDFDDLEQRTADLLRDFPLVRARYQDAEFKHILVDEFQDTNSRQWTIVQALADLERPGSLFVVGDPKQSIYAFRGADVSVFDQVKGLILTRGGMDVALARSFRTHHRLVAGFNHLFGQLLVRDAASPVSAYEVELGQPMEAHRQPAPSDFPSLELLLVDKSDLDKGDDSLATAARGWEAAALAERLHDMVAQGLPVYDRDSGAARPVRYGDVALLFQAMSNVTLYEETFKAAGLPFVTVAGRGYYSRQEVWDLLNLLRALHNPADDLSLASALRSPLFNLSDDALLALRLARDESGERLPLWDALAALVEKVPPDEAGPVAFARESLYALRDRAGRVTIEELLVDALEMTGFLATLTGLPDGARRRGNVEKLLEKARTSGQVTLGAFSRYLADLSEREVREGEALVDAQDAVTLMTIHASKGLEFPVVVLVDASWERKNPNTPPLVFDPQAGLACRVYDEHEGGHANSYGYHRAMQLLALRETAERKRLLYVAATRAQDYLLVSGQVSRSNDGWKAAGWLFWLLDALGLGEDDLQPGREIRDYPWGQAGITVIGESAMSEEAVADRKIASPVRTEARMVWEIPAVLAGEPLPAGLTAPPLVDAVPLHRRSVVRHLTATQIADLGSQDDFQRQRFRRELLHSAPSHIRWGWRKSAYIPQRILGEMVHEALRWWRFPTKANNQLKDVLRSYAWGQGIVDERQLERAIAQVQEMLERTTGSEVYRWIEDARQTGRPVYRELPFIYRYESHIIHGVIDTLFQREDGSWAVVDYKTSFVAGRAQNPQAVAEHARQYHLQVGVYATAAREQLRYAVGDDRIPAAFIHYIRYYQTVEVPTANWQAALAQLESRIGDILGDISL